MSYNCLFVGGPWDKKFISVEHRHPTFITHALEEVTGSFTEDDACTAKPTKNVTYKSIKLVDRSQELIYLYVTGDIEEKGVIKHLVESYANSGEE